ncbi:MAG: polysaccharide biosynthesis/export family protein [Caulobacteraceae bacterium]
MSRGALALASFLLLAVAGADRASERPATVDPPTASAVAAASDYRIGPLDKLDISVFQVKDLSFEKLQVDAAGQIRLPLIGAVTAAGLTAEALSAEIARRLGDRYLRSPQVTVVVEEAVSQKVSVEGAVNEAGVFELRGRTSLMEAVARAKGASKTANLHRVSIVRGVDGAPRAATFDLAAIRAGRARDPEVVANDVVVVEDSQAKVFWRAMVESLPALIVFSYF